MKAMTSGGEGDSSSSYSDEESDSEESPSTDLALMIKRFDRIHKNSLHANYKKRRSKPLTKSERTCHQCGEIGHHIVNCPQMKNQASKHRHAVTMKPNEDGKILKQKGKDEESSRKSSTRRNSSSRPRRLKKDQFQSKAYIGQAWNSETTSSSSSSESDASGQSCFFKLLHEEHHEEQKGT